MTDLVPECCALRMPHHRRRFLNAHSARTQKPTQINTAMGAGVTAQSPGEEQRPSTITNNASVPTAAMKKEKAIHFHSDLRLDTCASYLKRAGRSGCSTDRGCSSADVARCAVRARIEERVFFELTGIVVNAPTGQVTRRERPPSPPDHMCRLTASIMSVSLTSATYPAPVLHDGDVEMHGAALVDLPEAVGVTRVRYGCAWLVLVTSLAVMRHQLPHPQDRSRCEPRADRCTCFEHFLRIGLFVQ